MDLLDRIQADRARRPRGERRFSIDNWLTDYLIPMAEGQFGYGGHTYPYGRGPRTTYGDLPVLKIPQTLPGYSAALRASPPAFAAQMVRAMVMSQARFTFRNLPYHPSAPRKLFGSSALRMLERPWPNGTTGELNATCEWHAGLAGNAFVYRRPDRLRILRPDWVGVLWGSELEPDDPYAAIDGELIGYVYQSGGIDSGSSGRMTTLTPEDVAHWSPIPDPEMPFIGQSWVTVALRDIQVDRIATEHTIQYFRQGATPNMVVKGIPAVTKTQFDEAVDMMEERHAGIRNAYRTLYLVSGADAEVVGNDLSKIGLKDVHGGRETRIAMVGRVPAPLLQISEGLAGSSLNAGNFGMARRLFADLWVYPSLQNFAATLAGITDVPDLAELWHDTKDIPLLREDGKDAAEIDSRTMLTIESGVRAGFKPDAIVRTVAPEWAATLEHTGLFSVQLQPPGTGQPVTVQASNQRAIAELLAAGWTVINPPEPDYTEGATS